jgi:hypothetical protein
MQHVPSARTAGPLGAIRHHISQGLLGTIWLLEMECVIEVRAEPLRSSSDWGGSVSLADRGRLVAVIGRYLEMVKPATHFFVDHGGWRLISPAPIRAPLRSCAAAGLAERSQLLRKPSRYRVYIDIGKPNLIFRCSGRWSRN